MSVPSNFTSVIPSASDLRVVKATSVTSGGQNFWMKVHDSEELVPVHLISRPERQIKTWSQDDAMVVATPNGNVIFQPHAFSGPVFLITRKLDSKTNRMKNVRVTFYALKDQVGSVTPEPVSQEVEVLKEEKPVRKEGESFGKFQARLRAWKKAQPVVVDEEATA
ncbi:MAG: hypothetical protein [Caudoviricetes sp.]|nr:MAG: hypothetical protein [Caudoviricetes sp.]